MDFRIRPAEPTEYDAAAFIELGNMASHDLFSDIVGENYGHHVASWFLRDDNLYSYRTNHLAVAGDEVVALLCAFSGKQKAQLDPATNRLFAESSSAGGLEHQARMEPLLRFADAVPIDAFYIQLLAVSPDARGNGIAGKLLDLAESLAREHGSRTLELDVEDNNEAAIKIYRNHGMQIEATSPTVHSPAQHRAVASTAWSRPWPDEPVRRLRSMAATSRRGRAATTRRRCR